MIYKKDGMDTLFIRDAIHESIRLTPREAQVVDHPFMQRLRYIRQLGFVFYVYPCATHDRFSHSLGTLHIASLFCEQIFYNHDYSVLARMLNQKEKEFLTSIIRLSALVHDIGHAPFSHTAEHVMPELQELTIPASWMHSALAKRRARHEDYSVLLLCGMSEGNNAVISPEEAEIIASLIHHKAIRIPASWHRHFSSSGINSQSLHTVVKTFISSDIDADRMDYLLRDAHFAGVSYGKFDVSWLLSNVGIVAFRDGYSISISESGIQALEHYLLARYNMYAQVYMHKTVKCFDYFFHKAIEEKEIDYHIPADRNLYVAMRDSTLIELLFTAARRNPFSWSARLVNREPAKRLCRIWGSRIEAERIFKEINNELKVYNIKPFLYVTKSKFLELPSDDTRDISKGSLFSGLASVPIMVVRKQFGVVSCAPLSDYAFVLKRYHDDLVMGDIYVLRDQYELHQHIIQRIIKKFHMHSPTETIIGGDL